MPAENLPKIEENLRQPFEEHELPSLMKQLNVNNQRDLEIELARLEGELTRYADAIADAGPIDLAEIGFEDAAVGTGAGDVGGVEVVLVGKAPRAGG